MLFACLSTVTGAWNGGKHCARILHGCNKTFFRAPASSTVPGAYQFSVSFYSVRGPMYSGSYEKNDWKYSNGNDSGIHMEWNNISIIGEFWAGLLNQYSDWLQAGRSGDWIPVGVRFSAPVQTGPGAHPASCTMGTRSFLGVKSGRGVTLTPHPLLVAWSRKSRAIPLLLLWAVRPVQSLSACTVELYLYSPYGPYGLFRASVPVQ